MKKLCRENIKDIKCLRCLKTAKSFEDWEIKAFEAYSKWLLDKKIDVFHDYDCPGKFDHVFTSGQGSKRCPRCIERGTNDWIIGSIKINGYEDVNEYCEQCERFEKKDKNTPLTCRACNSKCKEQSSIKCSDCSWKSDACEICKPKIEWKLNEHRNNCNKGNTCERCRETINNLRDWEVKRKQQIIDGCPRGEHWVGNECFKEGSPFISGWANTLGTNNNNFCFNCGKLEMKNDAGDIYPCCQSRKPMEGNTQNKIKSYFVRNRVDNVTLKLDELTINYLGGSQKSVVVDWRTDDTELSNIKSFIKDQGLTILTRNDLSITDNHTPETTQDHNNIEEEQKKKKGGGEQKFNELSSLNYHRNIFDNY
jgi:hypothetical protein